MVKKLLSLVTVLVAFCSLANAQKLQKYEKAFPHKYNNVMMKAPATRASTDGVVFTYAYGSSIGLIGGGKTMPLIMIVPFLYLANLQETRLTSLLLT